MICSNWFRLKQFFYHGGRIALGIILTLAASMAITNARVWAMNETPASASNRAPHSFALAATTTPTSTLRANVVLSATQTVTAAVSAPAAISTPTTTKTNTPAPTLTATNTATKTQSPAPTASATATKTSVPATRTPTFKPTSSLLPWWLLPTPAPATPVWATPARPQPPPPPDAGPIVAFVAETPIPADSPISATAPSADFKPTSTWTPLPSRQFGAPTKTAGLFPNLFSGQVPTRVADVRQDVDSQSTEDLVTDVVVEDVGAQEETQDQNSFEYVSRLIRLGIGLGVGGALFGAGVLAVGTLWFLLRGALH